MYVSLSCMSLCITRARPNIVHIVKETVNLVSDLYKTGIYKRATSADIVNSNVLLCVLREVSDLSPWRAASGSVWVTIHLLKRTQWVRDEEVSLWAARTFLWGSKEWKQQLSRAGLQKERTSQIWLLMKLIKADSGSELLRQLTSTDARKMISWSPIFSILKAKPSTYGIRSYWK